MNLPIKLAVFDMAGTTVQDLNEVEACFLDAISETELQVDRGEINAMMGWSKLEVFERLWTQHLGTEHPDLKKQIETSYKIFTDRLEQHYSAQPVVPIDGIEQVFRYCKENHIKIALTTGFYRKVVDIILDRLGWGKYLDDRYVSTDSDHSVIDVSISSSEVDQGRPAPNMIFLAMQKAGIDDPRLVINFGDTPSDIQSARNAQVGFNVGVTYGTHRLEELVVEKADYYASNTEEVLHIIKKCINSDIHSSC